MPWTLDPAHSSVEFAVKHMVIASTKGRFTDYEADASIDETDIARSTATVRINAASVDTRDEKRDGHLRSADFFDAENNPTITFTSKRLEAKGGNDYKVVGDLTIRGITREIVLEGDVSGPVKDPWGGTRVGISATGKVNRKQFGLNWNAALDAGGFLVGDDVKLNIDAEFVRAA